MAWACTASNGNVSLVFINDVTKDRSSWWIMKFTDIFLLRFGQKQQSWLDGASQYRWTMIQNIKATQEFFFCFFFFNGKDVEYSAMAESSARSQPSWACISLARDKTSGRKTHKQSTTEDSCSKDLAKHHKGGNPSVWWCPWVPDLKSSISLRVVFIGLIAFEERLYKK